MASNKRLKIPYGVTDFATMRREGYYYVDKTRFINDDCKHSFLIELKYCKHGSSDAEVEKKHQEALDHLQQYSADKNLQMKAEGNSWTFHRFAIVFRGWKYEICEEVD